MSITEALGVDISGVIISKARNDSDTSFSTENYLETLEVPEALEIIRRLANERFGGRIFLVSKCGPRVQAKTLRWLKHHRFYERTGVKPKQVHFCLERSDKGRICHQLRITHFVDDRLDVLQQLSDLHCFLFDQQLRITLPRASSIVAVKSWSEIARALLDR
jgi:hypothetical protein